MTLSKVLNEVLKIIISFCNSDVEIIFEEEIWNICYDLL